MLYGWIIALIFYRYAFFAMSPSDLAPPYWINICCRDRHARRYDAHRRDRALAGAPAKSCRS